MLYIGLLGVPFALQELLLHNVFAIFCIFTHSTIFFAYASLTSLYIFQVHSPHSCYNTHHKTQSHFGVTSNVKKLIAIPSSHLFYLRQLVAFALFAFFFSSTPFIS
jgi:hypothetical protein